MTLRRIVQSGLALSIFLLPLVCLCQFVPGQGTASPPHLLLFPHDHMQSGAQISDDELAAIAEATGQPVSIGDDGEVIIGYGEATPPQNIGGCALDRDAGALEKSPTLSAAIPAAFAGPTRLTLAPSIGQPILLVRQQNPEPLEEPPPAF